MGYRVNLCIGLLLVLEVLCRPPCTYAVVCPVSMDTVFLLDGSSSIGSGNFNKIKEFVINVLQHFRISNKESRFGVVQYSTTASTEVSFMDPQNLSSVASKIRGITFMGGNTYTDRGLDKTRDVFQQGGRGHVPRAVVVINDGESSGNVAQSAQNLKNDGITIISLGIGPSINLNQLYKISTSTAHVYKYPSADSLLTHKAAVASAICAVSRQPYVYFTSVSENTVMIDHVITNDHVTDDLECSLKCLNNQVCFSFNYVEKSNMCQLNYSNKQATPDSVIFDDQSIHYDMVFR